jgi:hypothetical protein
LAVTSMRLTGEVGVSVGMNAHGTRTTV